MKLLAKSVARSRNTLAVALGLLLVASLLWLVAIAEQGIRKSATGDYVTAALTVAALAALLAAVWARGREARERARVENALRA